MKDNPQNHGNTKNMKTQCAKPNQECTTIYARSCCILFHDVDKTLPVVGSDVLIFVCVHLCMLSCIDCILVLYHIYNVIDTYRDFCIYICLFEKFAHMCCIYA